MKIGYDKAPTEDVHCKVYSQNHTLYVVKRNEDGTYGEPKMIKCDLLFNTNEKKYEEFIKANEDNQ